MAFKVSNNWNIGSVQLIQSMHSFKGRKKTDINVKKKQKPPSQANTTMLLKLQKVISGLCDASTAWWIRVNERFHKPGMYENTIKLFICCLRTGNLLQL